jgi:NAD(P)-dependent dehydrogenase (short-subunit alcohol dehydrogenase family)
MDQKVCLITGATSGIGKAAAVALAHQHYELILLGRSENKLKKVCAEISGKTRNDKVNYCVCDISILQAVRREANRLKLEYRRIDVLINNAGARFLQHQWTPEGIESTLATNHLGHFVLTLSLLGLLTNSASARIINVSSGAHSTSRGVIENIIPPQPYNGRCQYANSKLANVLFTYALANKLKRRGIAVNAVDPGGVATNFARNNGFIPWLKHRFYYLKKGRLQTPAQGAKTILHLASSDDIAGMTGKYFFDLKEKTSSDFSYDQSAQNELWTLSVKLGGIDL